MSEETANPFTTALSSWEEMERKQREHVRETKAALMPVLRDLNIKYVLVHYTGYGDSGQIEEVCCYGERDTAPEDYWDDKGKIDTPDVVVTLPTETGKKLKDVLEEFGWQAAYSSNPGFENNEGGQGDVVIDVMEDTVTIEHDTNILTVEHSTSEF